MPKVEPMQDTPATLVAQGHAVVRIDKVIHGVASRALYAKFTGGDLPSLEQAKDDAATVFEAEWRNGVMLSPEEKASPHAVHDDSKDFSVDLSAYHIGTVAPVITPVAVERHITVTPE